MIFILDAREQKNQHVLDYLRNKNVSIKFKGMKTGDYSAMITKNEAYGINSDMYLNAAIELTSLFNPLRTFDLSRVFFRPNATGNFSLHEP